MVGSVYFLSPLLRSLTRTVSMDSAILIISILLVVHVFTHDYGFINHVVNNNPSSDRLTGVVSLSSVSPLELSGLGQVEPSILTQGVLSSVVIASLLPSDLHCFAQVLFSLILFLLSPFVRRYVNHSSSIAHIGLGIAMVCGSSILLLPLSTSLFMAFILVIVTITFIGPLWLISIRKFKAHISGPWDEAMPDLASNCKRN